MKYIFAAAFGALAAAAPLVSRDDGPTYVQSEYQVTDFSAGSPPKSTTTKYQFSIQFRNPDKSISNQANCSYISGNNDHSGYISSLPTTACSTTNDLYHFSFERVPATDSRGEGYLFNVTDTLGGANSHFFDQALVTQVTNSANPGEPDPFPNYQLNYPDLFTMARGVPQVQ